MVQNDDPPPSKEKKKWFFTLFKGKSSELADTSSSQVVSKSLADSILKLHKSEPNHFNKFKAPPRDKAAPQNSPQKNQKPKKP